MFQQMKYFIAVVDEHSFTKAAEECNISQSAISQQIKELENTLAVELLKREGRSFKLTQAGEYFYHQAQGIVVEMENITVTTQEIANQNKDNTLDLGYLINFGSKEFLQAVAEFSKKNPQVKVKITSGMHEYLFNLIRNDKIDLNFSDQRRALSPEYNNEFLTETDFMAVLPPSFKVEDKISTTKLKDLPCIIVVNSRQEAQEEQYYREILGVKSSFLTVMNPDEAQLMVASNQGYLVANSRTINLINQELVSIIPLYNGGIALHQKYYAYWKKENTNPYIKDFAKILKKQFK